jgi:hypothetical protein
MVKTVLETDDLFVVGTRDNRYDGNYKPTIATLSAVANAVAPLILPYGNYGLYTQTSSSTPITNTALETDLITTGLGSLTIPANGFKVGDSFSSKLIGHLSCNGSATLRFRIKAGVNVLADTGPILMSAATNRHWELDVNFTVRTLGTAGVASIASGGIFSYTKDAGTNFEGTNFSLINNSSFDTTVNNTLKITAQWGAASVADSIYSEIFTLNKIY